MPRQGLRSQMHPSSAPGPGRPRGRKGKSSLPTTAQSSTPSHSHGLRSQKRLRSEPHVSLPSRKRRRSSVPTRPAPAKKQQTQEEIHVAESEDVEDQEEPADPELGEDGDDDGSAPVEPQFYERINNAMLRGSELNQRQSIKDENEGLSNLETVTAQQGDVQEQGKSAKRPVGRPRKNASSARQSGVAPSTAQSQEQAPEQPQEELQEEQAAEAEGTHETQPPSAPATGSATNEPRQSPRRQRQKSPYAADGSPELGTESPAHSTPTSPTKQARGQVAETAQDAEHRPRVSHPPEPSPDEVQGPAEEDGIAKGLEEFADDAEDEDDEDSGDEEESVEDEGPSEDEGEADETHAMDDSIFIEPPRAGEEIITTRIDSYVVNSLVREMGMRGWTGRGKRWKKDLLPLYDESIEDWLERHEYSVTEKQCRKLFRHLYNFWKFLHEMPPAPDLAEQVKYLNNEAQEQSLRKNVSHINQKVSLVCDAVSEGIEGIANQRPNTNRKKIKHIVKSLYLRILPMLGLLVMESFMAGGVLTTESNERTVSKSCDFTSSTIQFPLRVAGWMERLDKSMQEYLTVDPPRFQNDTEKRVIESRRSRVSKRLRDLGAVLRRAMKSLDEIATAPERKRKAIEQDQARRAAQDDEKRKREEDENRQMELHIRSLARIREREAQEEARRVRFLHFPVFSEPIPNDEEEEYFEKHGGWYQWEDKKLLGQIRIVLRPDYEVMADLVPGRSPEEVEQRVDVLRDRMRAKYLASGIEPPLWCYHHG